MKKFVVNHKKANGQPPRIDIADLIPVGREYAISREMLIALAHQNGLIESGSHDSMDRHVRELIARARMDHVILNLSDGNGYYRVSVDDLQDLQRYIRQEENRAKATFRNLELAKALYADYKAGRVG